jgi:DNA polymerase-3 subunit delta
LKIYADQFVRHLQGPLQNAYWISGDEPLQLRECTDALRNRCRSEGFAERDLHEVDKQFDWRMLAASGSELSLFADRKLIELRLRSSKLDDTGKKHLTDFLTDPPPDTLLLITSPKIESSATKTQWFSKIEQRCVLVQAYPVEPGRLPAWISRRMQVHSLTADADAVQLLCDRVEGNMLAADQEIEKLSLLFGPGAHLDIARVARSVADNSRFNVFALIDACLAGEHAKAIKTLHRMREEGSEPLMIAAMVAREVRQLYELALSIELGMQPGAAMQKAQVWKNRQPLVSLALQRHRTASLKALLGQLRETDISVKGMGTVPPWLLLEQTISAFSGAQLRLQSGPEWQSIRA